MVITTFAYLCAKIYSKIRVELHNWALSRSEVISEIEALGISLVAASKIMSSTLLLNRGLNNDGSYPKRTFKQ